MPVHYIFGVVWLLACLLLSVFVRGNMVTSQGQYKIGLAAIVISYLVGLCFLFVAISHS